MSAHLPGHVVRTPRLDLEPLAPPLVAALVAGDLARARALAPFRLEDDTFADDAYVLGLRHAQLTADPAEEPWLYRAAVDRDTGRVVARIGFHAPPDPDGVVEVGYAVSPAHRRQGLALEMCRGLFAWGAARGVRTVVASVSPSNAASLATVRRLGFVKTGEAVDEVDGLEWVHELGLRRVVSRPAPGGVA